MTHYDIAIIGSGSGNTIADHQLRHLSVAIVEMGVFGGTCLNVGCIPTKMFVYPADLAHAAAAEGPRLGVDSRADGVRWAEVRDRVFGRIDPISEGGLDYRRHGQENVTLYEGRARFTGDRKLEVTDFHDTVHTVTADQVVLASGSRASAPGIPGLAGAPGPDGAEPGTVGYHTSDTVMRLEELPERVTILGGGFIAAEFAHVFGSFGSQVTILNRSGALLRREDEDVSARFTELARERWDVRLDTVVNRAEPTAGGGARLHLERRGEGAQPRVHETDVLLVATGRVPNSDLVDTDAAGVETDEEGRVRADEHQRTTAPGVWALGDISSPHQLKHVANHEARVVQHNLVHPEDPWSSRRRAVPNAVFTHPQVAAVGLTEARAREQGLDYVVAYQDYADIAYGWAMEDTSGFAKVLAERSTGRILGGHIIGHEASALIQPLVHAMSFDQTAYDVARGQYWIHPALTELVENALLELDVG